MKYLYLKFVEKESDEEYLKKVLKNFLLMFVLSSLFLCFIIVILHFVNIPSFGIESFKWKYIGASFLLGLVWSIIYDVFLNHPTND